MGLAPFACLSFGIATFVGDTKTLATGLPDPQIKSAFSIV